MQPQPASDVASAFGGVLRGAFDAVEATQQTSDAAQAAFAAGAPIELHEVMVRVEEADLAFTTLVQVRNKFIQAYEEMLRMGGGG